MAFRPSPYDVVEASRRVWLDRWDPSAASGNAVFTSVLRAHQMLMARVDDVMRRHGLTFARYEVLAWLAAEPGSALALSWISDVLRIPQATVTNLIDRLVADELVRRIPHPSDARTTLAEITEHGRQVVDAATVELNAEVYEPLELDGDEREQLIDLLHGLRGRGGEFDTSRSDDRIAKLDGRGQDGRTTSAGSPQRSK